MPWPSTTPGGTTAPAWGPYVKLWVRAAIQAGSPFHMGAHPNDRLSAGNVLGGGAPAIAARAATTSALWIDLTCDTLDVEIAGGASSSQGVLSKADAGTCVVTLSDPTGKYDPLNPHTPYAFGGRSRIVPGVPVQVFAEVVTPATGAVATYFLFVGTADSWSEPWVTKPSARECTLIATDETKTWVRYNRPEQPPVGAGDDTAARVQRLVAFYGWSGDLDPAPASTVTLQATTLAQSGWELLNRALDDELGYVYFRPDGVLRWVNRATWFAKPPPVVVLGCTDEVAAARDVLVDAAPITVDFQTRNSIYAAAVGGTTQVAISASSVDRFGEYDYKRTDLGLADDSQAAQWAADLLTVYAFPQSGLEDVTMRPALDPASWSLWPLVLGLYLVSDLVRLVWSPPDRPADVIDATSRVVGYRHRITRAAWELQWQLVNADPMGGAGVIFTIGPDAQDRLSAGFVLG